MKNKIDRRVPWRVLYRRNDLLGVFKINHARHRDAEKPPRFLAVNHRNHARAALFLNYCDSAGAPHGLITRLQQWLQRRDNNEEQYQKTEEIHRPYTMAKIDSMNGDRFL